jgi:hypothetical protein
MKTIANIALVVSLLNVAACSGEDTTDIQPFEVRPALTSHEETDPVESLTIDDYDIKFYVVSDGQNDVSVITTSMGPMDAMNPLDNIQGRSVHTTLENFLALVPGRPVPQEFLDLHQREADLLGRDNNLSIPQYQLKQAITQAQADANFAVGTNYIFHDIAPRSWAVKSSLKVGSTQDKYSAYKCAPGTGGIGESILALPTALTGAPTATGFPDSMACNSSGSLTKAQIVIGVNNGYWIPGGNCNLQTAPSKVLNFQFFYGFKDDRLTFQVPQTILPGVSLRMDWGDTSTNKRAGAYGRSGGTPCHDWFFQGARTG